MRERSADELVAVRPDDVVTVTKVGTHPDDSTAGRLGRIVPRGGGR